MNIRLRCLTLLLWSIFAPCGQAGSLAGRTQQLASPDEVPEGLAQSDWQGIRAAYEAGRHAFQRVGDGWMGSNPGQRLDARFDGRGFVASPKDGGWEWGLELRSYGFAGQERAVAGPPVIDAAGSRLSCQWDGMLQEWWVNDSRGLEHGFTLQARPPRDPADDAQSSPLLSFRLGVRGGLSPRTTADAQTVEFLNGGGGAVLTYSGLKVWDATGRILPSRFAAGNTELQLLVEEQGARYPVTIDPVVQQAYLKASNTGAEDGFGWSVAVSGDTVVVGAYLEDSSATGVNGNQTDNSSQDSGAAYVFVRSGTTWSQQACLKASNTGTGDYFGLSVAVSGDTAVVGAWREDSKASGVNGNQADNSAGNSGAAYVFVRSGATWSQQAYLKASNTGAQDSFGWSVAVSGDTVVVGASSEDSKATGVNSDQADNSAIHSGAAYVFVRNGATWSQQAYLKASNTGIGDLFGWSVAVSGDTVVVGAWGEDSSATGVNGNQTDNSSQDSGAAYVFVRSGATWSQQACLKASNAEPGDYLGYFVAVSGDTVVVGAWGEDSSATGVNGNQADNSAADSGAAYVFVRSGATWSQQACLKASNTEAQDLFGQSVAVSGDTVVVGARGEASSATGVNGNQADNSAGASGAAYVFVRSGTTWSQQAYLKASNTEAQDLFGQSVAVSGDTVVVGARGEASNATGVSGNQTDNSAADSGAAYVFTVPDYYSLSTTAVNGTVTGAGDYAPGTTATLTATPHAGYVFTGWTGDAGGMANPLPVLMDSDRTIGAAFGPDSSDADGDGLSAYLERVVHGTNPLLADTDGDSLSDKTEVEVTLTNPLANDSDGDGIPDADEDPDGDGFTNRQELVLFLTDPNNGADRFTIALEYTASAHSLTFATVAGRTYQVERAFKPGDPAAWSERLSFIATGGVVTVPLGPPSSTRWFYRVRVTLN